jgi:hypothetical protein
MIEAAESRDLIGIKSISFFSSKDYYFHLSFSPESYCNNLVAACNISSSLRSLSFNIAASDVFLWKS